MSIALGLSIGLVAGLLGGILGLGGGAIMIPGMVFLLGVPQHTAQGVSLAVVVVTGLVGAITHYRQGNLSPREALWIAPTAILFVLLGVFIAGKMDTLLLRRFFALVLIFTGTQMLLRDSRVGGKHSVGAERALRADSGLPSMSPGEEPH